MGFQALQSVKKARDVLRLDCVRLGDNEAIGACDLPACERFISQKFETIDGVNDHDDLSYLNASRQP